MSEVPGSKRWIAGVDLGGTNIVVGLLPVEGGEVLGLRSMPTDSGRGAKFVVDRIIGMVEHSIGEVLAAQGGTRDEIAGVGIGSPGPLDRKTGTVINTPNLGWRNFPLRDLVSNQVKLPCTLDNDANCATYGEWWLGAGRGVDTLVGLTLGTGIGGGIVLNGQIYHGCSDVAGEIGHMTIDSNGRRCKCGNYGCLEQYASGPAIAVRAVAGIEAGAVRAIPVSRARSIGSAAVAAGGDFNPGQGARRRPAGANELAAGTAQSPPARTARERSA